MSSTAPIVLTVCKAEQCHRKMPVGTEYCCAPCRIAWESTPRFDIDGYHSPGCDERAAERGEFDWRTVQALRGLAHPNGLSSPADAAPIPRSCDDSSPGSTPGLTASSAPSGT